MIDTSQAKSHTTLHTTRLDPQVWKLFDQFVHGDIDRRSFVDRAARYCTGGMTAVGLLAALSPDFALAQKVAPQDPRIKTERVEYASPAGYGKVRAYVARPAQATGPLPVILVAHENRGLNPHIEDIARRLALDNFIAVAPDALFPLGGYPGDEDKARDLFAKLDQSKTREDWQKTADLFNEISDKARSQGMIVGYHNHDVEFKPLGGELPWDTFFNRAKKEVVIQFDTGNAGHLDVDPRTYLKKFRGRVASVHVKPYSKKNANALIGDDELVWPEIFDLCETFAGVEWYIIEYERENEPPLVSIEKLRKILCGMGKC